MSNTDKRTGVFPCSMLY